MNQRVTNLVLVGVLVALLGIGGYFVWFKKFPVQEISISENSGTMVSWGTYTNYELGYSVNYPPGWVVTNQGDNIRPAQPEISNGEVFKYFSVRIEDQSFEDARRSSSSEIGGQNNTESPVIFAGEKGYSYLSKFASYDQKGEVNTEFYQVLVRHNDKVYSIWTQKYYLDEVKQIFATFKFIESTKKVDTSGWKTYTNKERGFEFKYPTGWTIKEGNDYPGSMQGEDYIKLTKGEEFIYAGPKTDCIEDYKYCKHISFGPFNAFSTTSSGQEVITAIDGIVATFKIVN